jgi:hypothetical protein
MIVAVENWPYAAFDRCGRTAGNKIRRHPRQLQRARTDARRRPAARGGTTASSTRSGMVSVTCSVGSVMLPLGAHVQSGARATRRRDAHPCPQQPRRLCHLR